MQIALFALGEKTTQSLETQLRSFFSNVDISAFCLEKMANSAFAKAKPDLAVISSDVILPLAIPYIHPTTRTIVARRSLSVDTLDKLLALPQGTKVLACHKYPEGVREVIASIKELGISHIDCYSQYESDRNLISSITTALVAGEAGEIPAWVTKIIDIGAREIELASLVEIAHIINYPINNSELLSLRYTKEIVKRTESLKQALRHNELLHSQIKVVLNTVQDALIAIDNNGVIKVLNNVAEQLIAVNRDSAAGCQLFAVLPGLRAVLAQDYQVIPGKNLVVIDRKKYHVTVSPVEDEGGAAIGSVLALRDVTEVIRMETEVRKALQSRGHVARYTFDDILGISPAIQNTINSAKKLAASELNVLILGENGTGKELFAQSMHNASSRSHGPFVAANCAALPASLLESELFGYEEGAFTGARKGGKPGLIEQAHGGTIFLDEIGDISLEAQARLLRVIQEKEVMRVGCTRIIPVDVRIIAATNKDLMAEVNAGRFRQDLYYRLFVAPLYVPQLRQRKQDIPYLTRSFLKDNNLSPEMLDAELLAALSAHAWPGNVRELQSIIQYAAVISDGLASFKQAVLERLNPQQKNTLVLPLNIDRKELPLYKAILELFNEAQKLGYPLGRGQLVSKLNECGFAVSDQIARKRIEQLRTAGLLISGRGRQATQITSAGQQLLSVLNKPIG